MTLEDESISQGFVTNAKGRGLFCGFRDVLPSVLYVTSQRLTYPQSTPLLFFFPQTGQSYFELFAEFQFIRPVSTSTLFSPYSECPSELSYFIGV